MSVSHEEVLSWANDFNCLSSIENPEVTDGEALFFQGNIWHYSHNSSDKDRYALLLQYCTSDSKIRIPQYNKETRTNSQSDFTRLPCISVKGKADAELNWIVEPPAERTSPTISAQSPKASLVRPFQIPLPLLPPRKYWKAYRMLRGSTPVFEKFSCHVSTLASGHLAHPPTQHMDEEILLVLNGKLDLILPEFSGDSGDFEQRLNVGDFVHYPSEMVHTIRSVDDIPANYLVFRWKGRERNSGEVLPYTLVSLPDLNKPKNPRRKFSTKKLLEGETRFLKKLHAHQSILMPKAGYRAHTDPYDIAIVLLEGQLETLGRVTEQYSIIHYPAGISHGMRNPWEIPAYYLVFEFHGD